MQAYANIDIVTFTGIDALSTREAVSSIQNQYPRVEFGILIGNHSGEAGYNRFPNLEIVESWRHFALEPSTAMAIHLCGQFSQNIMNDEKIDEVLHLCRGFGRVQINASKYNYKKIAAFADLADCPKIVLQQRAEFWNNHPLFHPKIEYLFDLSEGSGLVSFKDWPKPHALNDRYGYAGGLGPSNMGQALKFADSFPKHKFWFDMESKIRTQSDYLDFEKVAAVCKLVFP